jgi:hypothetical protein
VNLLEIVDFVYERHGDNADGTKRDVEDKILTGEIYLTVRVPDQGNDKGER